MWFLISLVCVLLNGAASSNILGIFAMYLPSHHITFDALMVGLAERGHNVTVYSVYPKDEILPNYHDFSLTDCFKNEETRDLPRQEDILACEPLLQLRKMRGSFDLLITETFRCDFFALFGPVLNVPVILTSSGTAQPWMCTFSGMPCNPTYVPVPMKEDPYLTFSYRNFFSRLENTWNYLMTNTPYYYNICERQYDLVPAFFPVGTPSISTAVQNVSMWFFNTHYTVNRARPTVPNVVEIGGIHIRPPKNVPKDVEKFMGQSMNGVAIVSVGALDRPDVFPEEKRRALVSTLAKLPVRVILRWEADHELPDKTDNIMTLKQLPQRDMLADPRVKFFICDGSLVSIQEAVHEGVPVLGIPMTNEQRLNIRNLEEKGAGALLEITELTENLTAQTMEKFINSRQYRKNATDLSSSFTDRPCGPLDTAIFWTEYVIRHRGAAWLKTDVVRMSWWQYLFADSLAIVLIIVGALYLNYFMRVNSYYSLLGGSSSPTTTRHTMQPTPTLQPATQPAPTTQPATQPTPALQPAMQPAPTTQPVTQPTPTTQPTRQSTRLRTPLRN